MPPSRSPTPFLVLVFVLGIATNLHATALQQPVSKESREAHGPPSVTEGDEGSSLITAYVVHPKTGADIQAWVVVADPSKRDQARDDITVCALPGDQLSPIAMSDGQGGFIVAWQDHRSGRDSDLYAQRLTPTGEVDPAWPPDGVAVCTAAGNQSSIRLASDGAGGAFIAWDDLRGQSGEVFIHRLLASGAVDSRWPRNGRAVSVGGDGRHSVTVLSDGSGGIIAAWLQLDEQGETDIFAQHFQGDGELDAAWPEIGVALSQGSGDPSDLVSAPDGSGGALFAWCDRRDAAPPAVHVARITIAGVRDPSWPAGGERLVETEGSQHRPGIISNQMGGAFISWQHESEGAQQIRVQQVLHSGETPERWPRDGIAISAEGGRHGSAHMSVVGEGLYVAWLDRTLAGSVHGMAQLVMGGKPNASWPVAGAQVSTSAVDDLMLSRLGASASLAVWRNPDTGVLERVIVRENGPELQSTPPTLITALFAPTPNPARQAVTFRFGLAEPQKVRLTVYDVGGRRVAVPMNGALDAGPHQVIWPRALRGGRRAPAGLYFVRLETEAEVFTRRFILVR